MPSHLPVTQCRPTVPREDAPLGGTDAAGLVADCSRACLQVSKCGLRAHKARQHLQEAVASSAEVSRVPDGISAAASGQKPGVSAINEAAAPMDSIPPQNAAMGQAPAAAAQSVYRQAWGVSHSRRPSRLLVREQSGFQVDVVPPWHSRVQATGPAKPG